jgi:hypothetical protein
VEPLDRSGRIRCGPPGRYECPTAYQCRAGRCCPVDAVQCPQGIDVAAGEIASTIEPPADTSTDVFADAGADMVDVLELPDANTDVVASGEIPADASADTNTDVFDEVGRRDVGELDVRDVIDVASVRDVVDVRGDAGPLPGSPGAPCTLNSQCTRLPASCCNQPTHVCACEDVPGGSCHPLFCP